MSPEPVTAGGQRDTGIWRHNAEGYLTLIERGRNNVARTLLGCVLILGAWVGLGVPLYFLLEADAPSGSLREFVVANLGILVMLAGLAAAVIVVQRRSLLTLVTPRGRFDSHRAWQGFAAAFAIMGLAFGVECVLYPDRYQFNPEAHRWLWFAPVVLLLTPLQAATEELVFRGYLMQSLRSFTQSRWLIVGLTSVIFMLPHLWNPEAAHGLLVVLNYVLVAVFFALVTLRDGRLELAIGAHAAINVFIALIASYPDSVLNTPALFMADRLDPVYSLASVAAGGVLFYVWFFGRRRA
ncbi:MAG: CPBP family intramembrane metalloprotease [Betaproteobacteria bacterium]|nr:CPBP family intramembrane metalloprotease [Betaproteobacteria bacterium]